jgi:subtilisin family serine protease
MRNTKIITVLMFFLFAEIKVNAQDISPELQKFLDESKARSSKELIPILIICNKNTDTKKYAHMSLKDKPKKLMADLKRNTAISQVSVIEQVKAGIINKEVDSYKAHWICNVIDAKVTRSFIEKLKQNHSIQLLELDSKPELLFFEPAVEPICSAVTGNSAQVGLKIINAPKLWRMGITGEGRTMMILDTGVDSLHPALSRTWKGNHVPASQAWQDISAFSPNKPFDDYGHGTHVMGIMGGLDTLTHDTIGVAFNAEWIASNGFLGNISGIVNAYEWAMNPDGDTTTTNDIPDVINNSWALPSSGSCSSFFSEVFENMEAAGIAVVFAVGNYGIEGYIPTPQDVVVSLVNPFTVGSISGAAYLYDGNVILGFSSRGPTGCATEGSLAIKPEVVAAGFNVRSAIPLHMSSGPDFGYDELSGTSMASPHVAGAIVLLKQAYPSLSIETIKLALYNTAVDLGELGEDNTYGKGLIDIYAAYLYLGMTCDNEVIVDHYIYTHKKVHASERIIASSGIGENIQFGSLGLASFTDMHVVFTAGQELLFQHGFEVIKGNEFTATLQDCPYGSSLIANNDDMILSTDNSSLKAIANGNVVVYPIPAHDNVTIEDAQLTPGSYALMVIDVNGKIVYYKDELNQSKLTIPVGNWTNGFYFARIQQGKLYKMFKIVKN